MVAFAYPPAMPMPLRAYAGRVVTLWGGLSMAVIGLVFGFDTIATTWTPLKPIADLLIVACILVVWSPLVFAVFASTRQPVKLLGELRRKQPEASSSRVGNYVLGFLVVIYVLPAALVLAIPLAVGAITYDSDTINLSRFGFSAAVWASLDSIPLLSLPTVWGISEPDVAGTPLVFRFDLLLVKVATLVGLVALAVGISKEVTAWVDLRTSPAKDDESEA